MLISKGVVVVVVVVVVDVEQRDGGDAWNGRGVNHEGVLVLLRGVRRLERPA